MSIKRVAIIYNDKPRPETTGFYCRRALGQLVEVEHFLPGDLASIPRRGFDLYLHIDDGLAYRLPAELRPCAWWAIDTHLDFAACLEKAKDFDFVFAAQRDGAARLRQEGIASASWLPLACDPEIHQKYDVTKVLDVCFVGNVFPGPRAELLELLQRRFSKVFLGRCYFEEMAKAYSAARIVFNRSVGNDINMRVFEALACGSLLLTNELSDNGQEEMFQDGVHLATYADAEELLYKASYYLGNEEARERIAAAGRAEVLARHTYRERMARLLEACAPVTSSRGIVSPVGRIVNPSDSAGLTIRPTENKPPLIDPGYYECARPELLELIPPSAGKVLDIGCGAGRLGEALKARQDVEVTGIERNPEAARRAERRLDHLYVADAEDWEPPSYGFDAIVCGDVLEHLREPLRLLRRARRWLGQDGRLIASLPNVRHHSVLRGLLDGNWTYEPAGLLDQDHVRFFTRREIEKLFDRAGFTIADMRMVPGPGYAEWRERRCPGEVKAGRLHIGGLAPEEAEEFYVYQYLVSAAPAPQIDHGLTSIVIVTHNQLAFTRACLDSIEQYTDEPHEVIVVDNGSTDGTVEYLRARLGCSRIRQECGGDGRPGFLANATTGLPGVKLIANPDNRGFPAANNQGIAAAAGSQVLLLNNDTVVATGWLKRLLAALHSDPSIGLAGPCSNCVSGPQQIDVGYEEPAGIDGFAWDWARSNRGALVDTDRLVGFCLLIRRELIEKIGVLDERFGIGCFEDDDYCVRALAAGYRAVIVRDAFVHHAGGQTFRANGIDYAALMRKNEALFREKWQRRADNGQRPEVSNQKSEVSERQAAVSAGSLAVRVADGGGLVLTRKAIDLSVCIIARDNAKTIGPCLESIRRWADEVILVDTGSKDETPQIAAGLGARVFHCPWCDSFSRARNESLGRARGQWIFWMDSDDTIDETNGRKLREIVEGMVARPEEESARHELAEGRKQGAQAGVLGYVMQVHCPGRPEEGDAVTLVDHVKLFRNLPGLRFEGRIHEQIIPAIRRAGGDIAWTDVFVVHSGYDHSPEGQERKKKRDLHLLHLELSEQPAHPFTLFNLGMTYTDIGEYEKAVDFLRQSIRNSEPGESHLRKAVALLVHSLRMLGRLDEAWESCRAGLAGFPDDPELLFRKAGLLHARGQNGEAVRAYHDVLNAKPRRHFSSVVGGIQGFLARHNLALLHEQLGEPAAAEAEWRRICAEAPRYRLGWRGLAENLLSRAKRDDALAVAEKLADGPLRSEGKMLKARLAETAGDKVQARVELEDNVRQHPKDRDALEALCRFLFDHGPFGEAEQALEQMVRGFPDDGAANFNLGSVHLRQGKAPAAVQAFQDSLRQRPNWPATYLHLGYALRDCGRVDEAVAAWRKMLELSPDNAEAAAALADARRSPALSAGGPKLGSRTGLPTVELLSVSGAR